MNFFILIALFIPLSFAGSPPSCGELSQMVEGYEKDLQKKFITDCGNLDHSLFTKDIPVVDQSFLEGKVCSDLNTLETQIENLKIQEAVLTGINKLKLTIGESKDATESSKPEVQQVAGMTFVASLNTAQSMEVLLQSVDPEGKPFIQKLKEFPENKRLTQKDLSDRIAEMCLGKSKSEQNACNPKVFKPGPEAARELLSLIKSTDPTVAQISKWQGMLAIKRKNPSEDETQAYSFTDMQNELTLAFNQLDNKDVLTKDQIRAIQKLDDFENAPGLSFVEDLNAIKDQKKAKIASDKFFLLMGDAKLRQQYEVQSKLSLMWEEVKSLVPDLSEEQKQTCDTGKALYSSAKACLETLEAAHEKMQGDAKANLARFLPALRTSVAYADSLESKENLCRQEIKSQEKVTEACFADFNKDLATVQDQILQLNLLKDKIGSENMDLMKFRNFALTKYNSQKCQTLATSVDFCEENTMLSKEATMTFSDTMKIAVVFAPKPLAEEEAQVLCEEEGRKLTKNEERLCEFFNDTSSDIVETNNVKETPDFTDAPDGGNAQANVRDAWIQGGSNLLKDVLGGILNRQQSQMTNPYLYNYNPYNSGTPPLGIADSIMFNARYNGAYGFYMPTQGFQTHTAFGANAYGGSSYAAVNGTPSKYFSY